MGAVVTGVAVWIAVLISAGPPVQAVCQASAMSDAAIVQHLIDESVRRYAGRCACPYHSASNGTRCGGRSAYSRGGGASVLCYPHDVTPAMVARFRERQR